MDEVRSKSGLPKRKWGKTEVSLQSSTRDVVILTSTISPDFSESQNIRSSSSFQCH